MKIIITKKEEVRDMSKSIRTAVVAVISVLLIGAMIAGIWLFANGQTASTTLSSSNAPTNTVKSGDHYIYADDTVKTATGEYVYKVYCDNCSGSGQVFETKNEECSANCLFIEPYKLSGFLVDCKSCGGSGKCATCGGSGEVKKGWLNTRYGCRACGGFGKKGWFSSDLKNGSGECAYCDSTGKVFEICAKCAGSHFATITAKTRCSVCSGKGYYWMSGIDILDCTNCHGYGQITEHSDIATCNAGCTVIGKDASGLSIYGFKSVCLTCSGSGHQKVYGSHKNVVYEAYGGGLTGCVVSQFRCKDCDKIWLLGQAGGTCSSNIVDAECSACSGSGYVTVKCSTCNGTGTISGDISITCSSCAGKGWKK